MRRKTTAWRNATVALIAVLVGTLGAVPGAAASTNAAASATSGNTAAETPYPGGKWEPGPPKYGSITSDGEKITMDDGVILDASVAYPADLATGQKASGRFPVVIEHTPYLGPVNPYYAQFGYISVRVHDRGTGDSGGQVGMWSRRQARDGVNAVQWAGRKLKGSDGRVALVGCSWPGANALVDAAAVGPNSPLKAVVAACIGFESIQRDVYMSSGIPTQGISGAFVAAELLMGGNPATVEYYRDLGNEIMSGGPAAYDGAFWRKRMPMSDAQKIVDNRIPVLLWSGWRDNEDVASLRTYTAFQNASFRRPIYQPMKPNQPTTPRYQIIMGDWGHAQGLDNGIMLQWLETWVRGVDTGIQNTRTPMHLFEPGTDRWINAARFPAVSRYTDLFLGDSETLTFAAPTRRGDDSPLAWGDPDQAGNRLIYTTKPLTRGLTLSGPMSATVYASSSNTNLELLVRLYDVAPDGTAAEITRGTMLASQRELDTGKTWKDRTGKIIWPWQSQKRDDYLTPEKVYRLNVMLEARQWGAEPGHQLRLELTTQTPAGVCPGPTTFFLGTDPCYLTAPQQETVPGGTYRILHGSAHPTRLSLPVLPALAFESQPCAVTPTSNGVCLPQDWGGKRQR